MELPVADGGLLPPGTLNVVNGFGTEAGKALATSIIQRSRQIKRGNPLETEVMVGAQASQEQYDKILSDIKIGQEQGAREFGLGAGVWTRDMNLAYRMGLAIQAGPAIGICRVRSAYPTGQGTGLVSADQWRRPPPPWEGRSLLGLA